MLTSLIVRIVQFSMRHAYAVTIVVLSLSVASGIYVSTHFTLDSNTSDLIATNTPWVERGLAVDKAFPQRADITLAVVQAPAAEFADKAASELAARLATETTYFSAVSQPGAGPFFDQNGLLFLSKPDLDELVKQLTDARPLLNRLARDPSLSGLANLLSLTLLTPLVSGQVKLADMSSLLEQSAQTVDAVLAGKPAGLSWRGLVAPDTQPRSFIQIQAVPDYQELQAGSAASDQIRNAASELRLHQRFGASVHLTGPRPLADEELASVREGEVPNAIATFLAVIAILWLAVRSGKMIFAVFMTLIVGLTITTALGLLMVGSLNMISIAFAVLFVGIGVDYSIQFAVRYREERYLQPQLGTALVDAAKTIAMPLSLAAAATAASFFSFLPTEYRGMGELGLIAGVGILFVAFPTSLILLPAMITILKPKGERAAPGFKWLAPADRFTDRHRKPLLFGTLILVVACLPLLAYLRFDFNPLHLKDPHTEAMETLTQLAGSPEAGINDVQILAPSLSVANTQAKRLRELPEVGRVTTLSNFIPENQSEKLATIQTLATTLASTLSQAPSPSTSDKTRITALKNAAGMLENAALDHPGAGAAPAQHLAASLRELATASRAKRDDAEHAFSGTLKLALDSLHRLLEPGPITQASLPAGLKRQWLTPDGRALVDIAPKVPAGAKTDNNAALRAFTAAVLRAAPDAIGGPISIQHSAQTIIHAFLQASLWALISITVLLWLALRNFGDVLRTLVPLLVSAAVTLELAVVLNWPLNFANIIALPLLLGIGVAFKIYYVVAWREGKASLLQSGLTQAIILSAATTAVAFGSLCLSHHPGTASMGKLLALSLVCTLIGAVFFQPILMGHPRK
ncbi:MAG: RND transporter [Burkholderiaceae bacterium]|nr:MAG: RND transporter [Burkholderiaceae bacterium]